MRCLGFRTARAYQTAVKSGRLPIRTFDVPGRRGRFARTVDVADWLDALGAKLAAEPHQANPLTKGG